MTDKTQSEPTALKPGDQTSEPEETPSSAGWAGVVQVFITALGSASKYAVIVAGLLTALYFFIDQTNKFAVENAKDREHAEELNQKKLDSADKRLEILETQLQGAQKQLVATYQGFQDIGSSQINNLNKVLTLREQADTQLQEADTQLQQLEDRERKDDQELSIHKAASETLTTELHQKQQFISAQTALIDKVQADFDKQRNELEDAERSRLQDAQTFSSIKDNIISLANKVINNDGNIDDDTKALARGILRAVQDINLRLGEFIQNPNTATLGAVRPILIGMTRDEFNKINLSTLGISQLIWLEGKHTLCIIIASQTPYSYQNLLMLSFDKNILVDTFYTKILFGIKLHSPDDWNKELLALRSINPDGNSLELSSFAGDVWTIERALENDPDLQGFENIEVTLNKGQPVQSLSVNQYKRLFGYDYNAALTGEKSGEAAISFAMAARAADYDGVKIGGGAQVPSDLLERFNKVGMAAVEHKDQIAAGDSLDPSLDAAFLGRFAAVLLKRDFQIIRYQPNANASDPNGCSVIAEYHPLETGNETRTATFQFRRTAVGTPWRLTGMDLAGHS
jgi:hypothetical protein